VLFTFALLLQSPDEMKTDLHFCVVAPTGRLRHEKEGDKRTKEAKIKIAEP
jgi:hypothetical protein